MIILKSIAEIKLMREAGRVVAQVLGEVCRAVVPGVTTARLDNIAENVCRQLGAIPAFKGYHGYPFSLCCSVNEQVVHGFPNQHPLEDGDIISMDFGCILDGFCGDSAITVAVGKVSFEANQLMQVAVTSLEAGIERARSGYYLGDISAAVQEIVEAEHFSVVRQFVGHGIGQDLHEDPQVPNFGTVGYGVKLVAGIVLAIEPMVNVGSWEVSFLGDSWTAVTIDGKLSAHFEHTIAVTDKDPEILSFP